MATKKLAKPAKKSSKPMGASLTTFEFDDTAYDIERLARNAVLKHPAVQKKIESMKEKLSKHVNGHKGITAERAPADVPKNGGTPKDLPKLAGPAQAVSTRAPRQDKLPTPKVTKRKASRTSY